MYISCCCRDYYQTRSWCERFNTSEGQQFKILKIAYCAHRIKYLFGERRRGEEEKYLTLNRIKY